VTLPPCPRVYRHAQASNVAGCTGHIGPSASCDRLIEIATSNSLTCPGACKRTRSTQSAMSTPSSPSSPVLSTDTARGASHVAWIPKAELEHHEWIAAGRKLGSIGRCSKWWIGDWVRYGTSRWGEKYVEAAKISGYDPKTLRNLVWVASRFELSRRRDNLSWSHHDTLAGLEPDEQEQWLDRASIDRLSVSDLRTELKAHDRRAKHAGEDTAPATASIACPNCGHAVPLPARVGEQGKLAAVSRQPIPAAA
jgi:hypothetical protein